MAEEALDPGIVALVQWRQATANDPRDWSLIATSLGSSNPKYMPEAHREATKRFLAFAQPVQFALVKRIVEEQR